MVSTAHLKGISPAGVEDEVLPKPATYTQTMDLRFVKRWRSISGFDSRGNPADVGQEQIRVLQQAWVCRETGELKWEDVELVEDV